MAEGGRGQDQPQAVDVRTPVHLTAKHAELLRRGEAEFTGEGATDDGLLGRVGQLAEPEVDQLGVRHLVLGQDDVVRRDVPMDGPPAMGLGQAGGQPVAQRQDLDLRERTLAQSFPQGGAVDVLHDQIVTPVGIADEAVIADDGVVTDPAQDLRLTVEEVHDLAVGSHRGTDHLDRVLRTETRMPGQVDLTHAAAAQQPLDLVGVDQQGTGRDAVKRGRFRGRRRGWLGTEFRFD